MTKLYYFSKILFILQSRHGGKISVLNLMRGESSVIFIKGKGMLIGYLKTLRFAHVGDNTVNSVIVGDNTLHMWVTILYTCR